MGGRGGRDGEGRDRPTHFLVASAAYAAECPMGRTYRSAAVGAGVQQ